MMSEKIITGLKSLDVKTDAQWTQEGLVNLNAFKFVIGGEAVTREQLEEVAPGFTRETAPTYFDEKEGEEPAPTAPTETPNVATEPTTTTSELTVGVKVELSDAVRTLLGTADRKDIVLTELSDEQLAGIMKQVPERRNALINLREEFAAVLEREFNLLIELEGEVERRTPKANHADMVKRIHEANQANAYIVDQPRQRVAQPIPPLKK